jgi:anti-sigma factor RsiW
VTHADVEGLLSAWLDDELAPDEARAVADHVATCAECATVRDDALRLRSALRSELPRFEASDLLRARIQAAARARASDVASARRRPRYMARYMTWIAAAAVVLAAVGSWQLATRRAEGNQLAQAVLATHVRSLMPGHLTDVVSSDQHTVKPWFDGRLDFSPPVPDFASKGFPLVGGRMDYIGARAVATLVYARRLHMISVTLWPRGAGPDGGPAAWTRQGYHLLHWNTPEYTYWVASDLGQAELRQFAAMLQQSDRVTEGTPP